MIRGSCRRSFLVTGWLLAVWSLISLTSWASSHAIPTPWDVFRLVFHELSGRTLWWDIGASVARLLTGLLMATVMGGVLGFVLGWSPRLWQSVEPVVDFVRAIPPVLVFPLFLLALGYGETARISAIVFGTIGIVVLHVATALSRSPRARVDTVRLAGLRGHQVFFTLYLFEALPALFTAIRLAITAGLIVTVVTEMLVGARHGLGSRALAALIEYRSDLLWLVILVSGAINLVLSSMVVALERRLVHWSGT